MAYAVELTQRAERDLDYLYRYIKATDSTAARRWMSGLERAILGLQRFPRRCPKAPEASRSKRPLRHLLYGTRRDVYRVLYEIDEASKLVRVLTIRHGAMDDFLTRQKAKKRP